MRTLLLILICAFSLSTCTTREELLITPNEVSHNDNVKIQTLTSQIEQLNKEFQHPQTRSRFLDRLLSVLYSDACGYSFGRKYGLDYRFSLVCGAVTSLATAIFSDEIAVRTDDNEVHYTSTLTDYEIIGSVHNEAIARTLATETAVYTRTSTTLPIEINEVNSVLIHNVTTQVNECLAKTTIGDIPTTSTTELPTTLQSELISFTQTLAKQNDIKSTNQVAKDFLVEDTDALNLLEQYVTYIGNVNNKEEIRSFTIQINKQIDVLSISSEKAEYLKTILSIAENSYSLWTTTE